MNRTIWVVMGSTGEYSDHRTWFVCAYPEQAAAERHADAAAKRAKALHDRSNSGEDAEADEIRWDVTRLREWMGDLDPVTCGMSCDGSDYVALAVEMREAA